MNRVELTGNLVRDPEMKAFDGNVKLCKFTIAVSRNYRNANGERESDFFNIITWRGLAETVNRICHKGDTVGVTGKLTNREYEDKNGNKRTVTEIVAEDVEFLNMRSAKKNGGNKGDDYESYEGYNPRTAPVEVSADELPF